MGKPILFGVYEQAAVGVGGSPSFWTHPLDERLHIDKLPFWINLAQIVEQGNLDLLFFGDVLGLYDVYRGNHHGAVEWAVEAPANDPIIHVSALSAVTDKLGFGLTASTTYESPFAFARRLSTLDHLSSGRVGWNIVTSYLDNAARNFGLDGQIEHDKRYDRADEFLDVAYKLWEGSWADDAVVGDKEQRLYARGDRVRPIDHVGEHFRVAGPHLTSPSPQRTPLLFQSGWSARGKAFAAKHAEVIFIGHGRRDETAAGLKQIRTLAADYGRDGDEIKALSAIRLIVGETEIQTQKKYDLIQQNYHVETELVSYGGDTGIDLSKYADDEPVTTQTQGFQSQVVHGESQHVPTAREIKQRFASIANESKDSLIVGTPAQVADQLEEHVRLTGSDGFLLAQYVTPGTVEDFVELVVPELTRRGLYDNTPKHGTLRSRFRDDHSSRLSPQHYGSQFRFPPQ